MLGRAALLAEAAWFEQRGRTRVKQGVAVQQRVRAFCHYAELRADGAVLFRPPLQSPSLATICTPEHQHSQCCRPDCLKFLQQPHQACLGVQRSQLPGWGTSRWLFRSLMHTWTHPGTCQDVMFRETGASTKQCCSRACQVPAQTGCRVAVT